MGEWIRFGLIALCVVTAMTGFTAAVIGANRFGFVMNRMHAAGIGDTLGIFGILLALMLKEGAGMVTAKMAVIIIFLWFTSPASSHFLSQIEYFTNPHLFRYTDRDLTVRSSMPAAGSDEGEANSEIEAVHSGNPGNNAAGYSSAKNKAPELSQTEKNRKEEKA